MPRELAANSPREKKERAKGSTMAAPGMKNALLKSGGAFLGQSQAPVMDLYRAICREIPRIMTIYDVDMDTAVVSPAPLPQSIVVSGGAPSKATRCIWICASHCIIMCDM